MTFGRSAKGLSIELRLRRLMVIDQSGCWIWQASRSQEGYSKFDVDGRTRIGHRVSYETFVGPIPDGLELDHLCRVTLCINPNHLEPVTHAENKRRRYLLVTHCVHGHEFSSENTYVRNGRRSCRACNRAAVARSKLARAGTS